MNLALALAFGIIALAFSLVVLYKLVAQVVARKVEVKYMQRKVGNEGSLEGEAWQERTAHINEHPALMLHELELLTREHPLLMRYLNERFNRLERMSRAIMDAAADLQGALGGVTTALGTVSDDLSALADGQSKEATALGNVSGSVSGITTEIGKVIGLLTPGSASGDKPVDAATVEQAVELLKWHAATLATVDTALKAAVTNAANTATAIQAGADAIASSNSDLTNAANAAGTPVTPPPTPPDAGTPPASTPPDAGTPPAGN